MPVRSPNPLAQLWTQSAQNLWDEQGEVGAPTRRAVVSWIGYVTPPPGVDAALGDYAARELMRRGIEIHVQTRLDSIEGGRARLSDGTELDTATLVWTTGVRPRARAVSIIRR